jgi:hypothetical protein
VFFVVVEGATRVGGYVVGGWSFGVEVFDRGREAEVEKTRRFRGCAMINCVARLEGLSVGIFNRNRPCDESRGCFWCFVGGFRSKKGV